MQKKILSTILIAFSLCYTSATKAQWTTDVSINTPACIANGAQGAQKIMADGHGGAFVAWQDSRNGDDDIYMQHIDSSGTALWTTDGVLVSTAAFGQNAPVMCSDGNDGVIVAWQDDRAGAGNTNIYAQRVDGAGNMLWAANGVPVCTAVGTQWSPTILADNAGGAYITWYTDDRSTENDVYIQRIDNTGAQAWTTNGINVSLLAGDQRAPSLATDGNGGVIITWNYYSGISTDVYAQHYNLAGVAQWTSNGVAVCTEATADQYNPKIASDNNGGGIITWLDYRASGGDVYAQRINASGIVQWTADGIAVCNASNYQGNPVITSDEAGGAYIVWVDKRNGTDYDVYAQHVNAGGTSLWAANGLAVSTATDDQDEVALCTDGNGSLLVSWRDFSNLVDLDIYAQKINAAGAIQWTAGGVVLANGANDQNAVDIASDNNGGAIVVFQESFGLNVFVQNVCYGGVPGPFADPVITITEYNPGLGGWISPAGGTISASGNFSTYTGNNAFDGDTTTYGWVSNFTFPVWLEYDFGTGNGKVLAAYKMFFSSAQDNGWGALAFLPSAWTFEGYNGTSWDTLDTRTGETPALDAWTTYSFANGTSYQKYRIHISANPFGGYAVITEMRFMTATLVNLCSNRIFTSNTNFPPALANYDWHLNGVSLGVNNDTLTLPSSNNGDVVSCIVTSNACVLSTTIDTSNTAVITTPGYPFINVTGDTTVCAGASTTITAGGGLSYQWSTGSTSSSVTITPLADSLLTVAVVDTNGCLGYTSQMVYVNPLPNTATTTAGITISAVLNGASYQWIDCSSGNAAIGGATNQSFTPVMNGNYAVIVNDGNCADTSSCVAILTLGLNSEFTTHNSELSVIPNPNNGTFIVKTNREGIYSIVNELGQTVQTIRVNATNNYSVSITDLPAGIYFVVGADNATRQKIVVTQ